MMKKSLIIVLSLLSCAALRAQDGASTDNLDIGVMIQPATADSFFRDADYYNWCSSIVKDGEGVYHLFYCRWPKAVGFYSWLTRSEVARATASSPEGPYRRGKTLLEGRPGEWDGIGVHNAKVEKFGGRYYLYYNSTNTGNETLSPEEIVEVGIAGYGHRYWGLLRNNQRVGVAVSDSPDGPWERKAAPLIEPSGPIKTITNNPAVAQGADGRYYLIVKGDDATREKLHRIQAVAVSDSPDGPFAMQSRAAFSDISTEDVSIWYDESRGRFYAVFHVMNENLIGLITSEDGIEWRKARHYEICKKEIPMADGSVLKPDRMERPFVYVEQGKPVVMSFGVKTGDDAFIVLLRLK